MFTFTRKALVAAMVLAVAAATGCRENQRSESSARDDFKDLVLLQVNPPDLNRFNQLLAWMGDEPS